MIIECKRYTTALNQCDTAVPISVANETFYFYQYKHIMQLIYLLIQY